LDTTLDTTAPTVTISSPTSGQSFKTTPAITGQATDNVAVTLLQATVDGGTAQTVTTDSSGNFTFTPAVTAEGNHTVVFTAKDAAGNTSTAATVTFAIDTTAPTLTITNPASGQSFTTNPAIFGHVTDNVAPTQVHASIDGGAVQSLPIDAQGNFSITPLVPADGSANGAHSVTFTASDAADNTSAPVVFTYTLNAPDITAPTVTITSPANGAAVSTSPAIVGKATDNVGVTLFQASVDGGAAQTVTTDSSGNFTFNPAVTAEGNHTVAFTAKDAAGNTSTATSLTFTLDQTPPVINVAIQGAPPQTINPTMVGQVTDNVGVQQLVASVDGGTAQDVTLDSTGHFTFTPSVPTDGSANGQHMVTFIAKDTAGNGSNPPIFVTFPINAPDVTKPVVTITSPANNQTFTSSPTIIGKATDNVAVTLLQVSVDGGAAQNVTVDAQGNYSFTPLVTASGPHTATFTAKDAAGNTSNPATLNYTL
jgi:hypothetical protein